MRTKILLVPFVSVLAATGCTVYTSDTYTTMDPYTPPPAVVMVNAVPWVAGAEAGVYWDNYNRDDVWYFEADTADADGAFDVVSVWADVYDEYANATYVMSFELFPSNDPAYWYSDWLGRSTELDPFYGGYTVDFVAYDTLGDSSYTTVWALSY